MKVICISLPKNHEASDGHRNILKTGKEYNVVDAWDGWYELLEDIDYGYKQKLFVPLSDIDETERIDEVMESIFQPVQKDQK